MRDIELYEKKKRPNGEGRQDIIKHVLIPEEVVKELRLYREAYSICKSRKKDEHGYPIPRKSTYEVVLRRWMDRCGRMDPEVKEYVEKVKTGDMKYFFEKDGEQMEAHVGDYTFYASWPEKSGNGEYPKGARDMMNEGWVLVNEYGRKIKDIKEAKEIYNRIQELKNRE